MIMADKHFLSVQERDLAGGSEAGEPLVRTRKKTVDGGRLFSTIQTSVVGAFGGLRTFRALSHGFNSD
jgi:hypothetical protein